MSRPEVRGKFLFSGERKLWIRGVTYGGLRPDSDGQPFSPSTAETDLSQIAANGFNAVRTYTVPPRWFLDLALEREIWVMVGLPWEQHVAFLNDSELPKQIVQKVKLGVHQCAGHPAVLWYAIGNEIPAGIVRWHGPRKIERFLKRLAEEARNEDPGGLITYVNYPSTEYLDLPFLDVVCWNIYLESDRNFEAYLERLQNLAGDLPLVIAEIGLDSQRNGELAQARLLERQIRSSLRLGCAGAFVFSWTDEWHRGGFDVEDWDFGMTRRNRDAKPALAAARKAFAEIPFPPGIDWPRISVIVCTYNGSRTITDCFSGLRQLEYPNFEVIVINDGSTDETEMIAKQNGMRVISTDNRGLAAARNAGMQAATGQIIAYIDDDVCPDPHWLHYLAWTFLTSNHVGVGGPNIPPPNDGDVAECVANAPGGPVHVLLSDTLAEHLPGCNMAFRRSALEAVGGFDAQFRVAGDDVDICWRLIENGGTLGFNPGASVLHHRRNRIRAYWKQQKGYGKAEALLERKWPDKYNNVGHLTWSGRLYGRGLPRLDFINGRNRIYQGTWGTAAFQSSDRLEVGILGHLLLMPEWFLLLAALFTSSILGLFWHPLLLALPFFAVSLTATLVHAGLHGTSAVFHGKRRRRSERLRLRLITGFLHLIQPVARLVGRLRHGLTPWRGRAECGFLPPTRRSVSLWSVQWKPGSERLRVIEQFVREEGLYIARGGPYDQWDLDTRAGLLGGARALAAIEEHGSGNQLIRLRIRPRFSPTCIWLSLLFVSLSMTALADHFSGLAIAFAAALLATVLRALWESGVSSAALHQGLKRHEAEAQSSPVEKTAFSAPAAAARQNPKSMIIQENHE